VAGGRNKLAVCSRQYAEDEEQSAESVEPNFIRLAIDLPGSYRHGRVCEEMGAKVKIKNKICQGHPNGNRQIAESKLKYKRN